MTLPFGRIALSLSGGDFETFRRDLLKTKLIAGALGYMGSGRVGPASIPGNVAFPHPVRVKV